MSQARPQWFSELCLGLLGHLTGSHERPRAMLHTHEPFFLQFSVRGCNRVQIYAQVFRNLPDRRQRCSLLKFSASNQHLNFLSNLAVNRTSVSLIDGNVHSRYTVYS